MQIRHELERAGLDPSTVNAIHANYKLLKQKQVDANEARAQGGPRPSKQGQFALGIWHRLLTVLLLMYQNCDRANLSTRGGPDEGADFRLAAKKWMEKPAWEPRPQGRSAPPLRHA